MNDYHNGDNLGLEPHVQDDYTITVSPDPRGLHVAVHRGSRCVHSEVVAVQVRGAAEPSDEEIDAIAMSMPDGAGGMLKQWGYRQFARALLSRYGRHAGDAQTADDARDAARYRWLRNTLTNSVGGGVEVNDDALVYQKSEPGEEVRVYWYPDTPVGFYEVHGSTIDAAIDAAMQRTTAREGEQ